MLKRNQELNVNFSNLDVKKALSTGKAIKIPAQPRPQNGMKGTMLKQAVNSSGHPYAALLVDLTKGKTAINTVPPKNYTIGLTHVTIGIGGNLGHAVTVMGVSVQGGVYGSYTGEFGMYYGAAHMAQTNISASAGGEVIVIYGTPNDFSGASLAIGVDCDLMVAGGGIPIGGSFRLIFQRPTMRLLGWSLGVGASWSILPANITVETGYTNIKPLAKLW